MSPQLTAAAMLLAGCVSHANACALTLEPIGDLTVRRLRKEHYRIDGGAANVPYDLVGGWGPMADSQVVDRLDIK